VREEAGEPEAEGEAMKPVEYWICAVIAKRPKCWEGPFDTEAAARKVKKTQFPDPKFVVCRVSCEVLPEPKPKTTTPRRKFTR
jgi:hypothetical protein